MSGAVTEMVQAARLFLEGRKLKERMRGLRFVA